jgi:hypothetical protein
MCRVAAELGIFCRGFRRWPDREFHDRFKRTLGVSTHLNRTQMETLADLWQLTEQVRLGVGLACDAARRGAGACRGWDELTDAELRKTFEELSTVPKRSKESKPSDQSRTSYPRDLT